MKKQLGGLLLAISLSTAQATVLTDTTPGGSNDPASEATLVKMVRLNAIAFFDAAALDPFAQGNPRWLNGGQLNGGNTFLTNLLEISPTPNCNISWDFSFLPGYSMNWIVVLNTSGDLWNIYHVNYSYQLNSLTNIDVTVNNRDNIGLIAFYGRTPQTVSDSANSVLLFGIGLSVLSLVFKFKGGSSLLRAR